MKNTAKVVPAATPFVDEKPAGPRTINVGHDKATVHGHNPGAPAPHSTNHWVDPNHTGHEDIDTDDRRKALNRMNHSSYRK